MEHGVLRYDEDPLAGVKNFENFALFCRNKGEDSVNGVERPLHTHLPNTEKDMKHPRCHVLKICAFCCSLLFPMCGPCSAVQSVLINTWI